MSIVFNLSLFLVLFLVFNLSLFLVRDSDLFDSAQGHPAQVERVARHPVISRPFQVSSIGQAVNPPCPRFAELDGANSGFRILPCRDPPLPVPS